MKLSREMMEPMMQNDRLNKQFHQYCYTAFLNLRRQSHLFLATLQLMLDAGIPDIALEPDKALSKVQELFLLQLSEDEAVSSIKSLLTDSINAVFARVVEEIHKIATYWR